MTGIESNNAGSVFHQRGEQDEYNDQEDDTPEQNHGLCVTQGIEQREEDQRDQQNIEHTEPVEALENEENSVEKIRHYWKCNS
jgi:hypothetical protein